MLAERLGMTVAELGRRMTSAELTEWVAFDSVRSEERAREGMRRGARAHARKIRQRG